MAEANHEQLGAKWAARLACALLAAFALVAVFTFNDHTHRAALERVEENSAVGDQFVVKPPADLNATLGTFQGRPLTRAERMKARDTSMVKAGMDDSHTFFVYRSKTESGALFLKIGPDDYLKIPARYE